MFSPARHSVRANLTGHDKLRSTDDGSNPATVSADGNGIVLVNIFLYISTAYRHPMVIGGRTGLAFP